MDKRTNREVKLDYIIKKKDIGTTLVIIMKHPIFVMNEAVGITMYQAVRKDTHKFCRKREEL